MRASISTVIRELKEIEQCPPRNPPGWMNWLPFGASEATHTAGGLAADESTCSGATSSASSSALDAASSDCASSSMRPPLEGVVGSTALPPDLCGSGWLQFWVWTVALAGSKERNSVGRSKL